MDKKKCKDCGYVELHKSHHPRVKGWKCKVCREKKRDCFTGEVIG